MVWKYGNRYLKAGVSWTDDNGIKHPRNWGIWSEDHKKNIIGLTWENDPAPINDEYYSGRDTDGNLVARDLATLKVKKIQDAKDYASSELAPTDWYVVRKSETNTAIPSEISAFRTAVRANYVKLKTAITNASNVDALIAVYNYSNGASTETVTFNGTDADVISTSDNTVKMNGHGYVDDEVLMYYNGGADNDVSGLIDGTSYYVFEKSTNDFKLSESHSNCGDASAVSIDVASSGTSHQFIPRGIPADGCTWPHSKSKKYDGA